MCLLVAAWQVVDGWPLVVAANRDERLDRPADPVQLLRPGTLGGRDRLAGGTWLAVNDRGVIAGLTNQPSPDGRDPSKRSRGEIPLLLTDAGDAASAVAAFQKDYEPGRYNRCWVLVGDRDDLFFVDVTGPGQLDVVTLPPGVHVLENKPPADASAKVDRVRSLLGAGPWDRDGMDTRLRGVLADHVQTQPGDDLRAKASACCVHADGYGTRSAMMVWDPPSGRPEVWAADGPSCTMPLACVHWD